MHRFGRIYSTLSHNERTFVLVVLALLLSFSPILAPSLQAQTEPAQTNPKVHRKVVQMVDPDYPTFLRTGHFQGLVIIEATVQPNGNVSKTDIKGGNPMLSQYAAAAVLHWKYAPGPDKTVEEVIFHFNANDR